MTCASGAHARPPTFIHYSKFTAEDILQIRNCENPHKMLYTCCGYSFVSSCGATKDFKCYPCAVRAKRDKKLAMVSGLNKSPMGWIEVSLTAPGANKLPWNKQSCNHISSMKCSGKIGCKVDEIDGALFNSMMPKNWNRWMQDVRKAFKTEVQFGKVFEAQARDVLHIHALIIGAPNWPIKKIEKKLRHLGRLHDFGVEMSIKRVVGDSPTNKGKAVNYASKYLTKGSETLKTVSMVTGEIKTGGYRDFTQSRHFGDTLKEIRRKRLIHWQEAQCVEGAGKPSSVQAKRIAEGELHGDEVALDNYKKSYTNST